MVFPNPVESGDVPRERPSEAAMREAFPPLASPELGVPEPGAELPEECPTCKRRFRTKQGLAMHKTRAHGQRGARNKRKRKSASTGAPEIRPARVVVERRQAAVEVAIAAFFPDGVPAHKFGRVFQWVAEGQALANE